MDILNVATHPGIFLMQRIVPLQEAALKFLEDADQDQLTNLLAEVCPVDDENSNALDSTRNELISLYRFSASKII